MIDRFGHLFIAPADFDASMAFYRDVLGWTVVKTWDDAGGGRGAVLSGGGIKVVLSGRDPAVEKIGKGAAKGNARPHVHLDIHDVEARFKDLPKGAHVALEPQETHWGTRWFVVRDPDGNLFAFEEMRKRD